MNAFSSLPMPWYAIKCVLALYLWQKLEETLRGISFKYFGERDGRKSLRVLLKVCVYKCELLLPCLVINEAARQFDISTTCRLSRGTTRTHVSARASERRRFSEYQFPYTVLQNIHVLRFLNRYFAGNLNFNDFNVILDCYLASFYKNVWK